MSVVANGDICESDRRQFHSNLNPTADQSGLSAKEETLISPMIDLQASKLDNSTTSPDIALFPSNHDAAQDGAVKLIKVVMDRSRCGLDMEIDG